MNKPKYATNEITQILTEYWNSNPSQRPSSFPQLEETLINQINPAIVMSTAAKTSNKDSYLIFLKRTCTFNFPVPLSAFKYYSEGDKARKNAPRQ